MPSLDPIVAIRKVLAEDPTDIDTRLVLADALEDSGDVEGADFQRLLVAFCKLVSQRVNQKLRAVFVGASEFRVWVRVYTGERNTRAAETQKSLYAWIRKKDGAVFRGGWKKADGPLRFLLSDGVEKYGPSVGTYGLAYLK